MLSTVGYHKSHFWLNEDDNYKVEYLFWSQHWDTGITQNLFFQHWGIFLHWSILKVTSRKEADIQFTIDNFMDPTLQKNMGLYLESMKKKSNKPTPQPPKHWADVKEESWAMFPHSLHRCLLMAIKNLNEILRLLSAGKLCRETQCPLFTCCLRIFWNYSALSLDWKMASRGPQVGNSLNYPELEDPLNRGPVEQSCKKREN